MASTANARVICDAEGVPELIQRLEYLSHVMMFKVTLFNGDVLKFCAERVCPSIGLMQSAPTRMQWLEAENGCLKELEFEFPMLRAERLKIRSV